MTNVPTELPCQWYYLVFLPEYEAAINNMGEVGGEGLQQFILMVWKALCG